MLVQVPEFKEFLNVSGGTKDAYYGFLLKMVDAYVKTYVQQNLELQTSIIEYYATRNTPRISLHQRPVVQIRNLWYDPNGQYGQVSGSFDSVACLQVVGSDYILEIDNPISVNSVNTTWKSRSGIVFLLTGQGQGSFERRYDYMNWQNAPSMGTIKVEYDAGYPVVPDDLKLGICMMTKALERNIPYGGVGQQMSENTQKYSYTLTQVHHSDMGFERLLARYKGLGMSIV